MATSGEQALARVVSLKDRASRFAEAQTLEDIRPDLGDSDPGIDLEAQQRAARWSAIQNRGPQFRVRSLGRLMAVRRERGLT